MATNKQNIIVLTVSVVISAAIWIITMKSHDPQHLESRVFKVENGWGYDVLVNDSVVIHQELVPAIASHQAFAQKEQARRTAALVIEKLKNGQHPTLTKFELQKILAPDETNRNGQRNLE